MDPCEQQALSKCHVEILRDLDLDLSFLMSLYLDNIITDTQKDEIQCQQARRSKVAKLLEILPRRGPKAFSDFVLKIKPEYPWLSEHLLKQLQTERTNLAQDLRDSLTDLINKDISPFLYGHVKCLVSPSTHHPQLAVTKLEELLASLQQQCYVSLEIPSKDWTFRDLSLPESIRRKLMDFRQCLDTFQSELDSVKCKKKSQKSPRAEKEVTKLKRQSNKLTELHKKLESSIKNKDKNINALKRDSALLKKRLEEIEQKQSFLMQRQNISNNGQRASISELFMY